MKKTIRRIFLKFFDPIAFRFGYNKNESTNNNDSVIDLYNKNNLLKTFYCILKSINFKPEHIVDIGANHGTWTREALIEFPNCIYTLVEPQSGMKESIEDLLETNPNISFNAFGAGKKSGLYKFTIADRDDSGSFIYSEGQAKEKGFKQIEVPIITLNELIEEKNLPIPDIIKIDAEGLDIEVLEGSSNFFGKTEVFMVEAGVVNKVFTNSFLELINFMDEKGYRLFDITDLNRPLKSPVLWLVELVFVKKNGIIDSFMWI
ncbi:MAG: FkbM family methyltransferase [Ginsengibacter sp.]